MADSDSGPEGMEQSVIGWSAMFILGRALAPMAHIF